MEIYQFCKSLDTLEGMIGKSFNDVWRSEDLMSV